MPRSGVDDSLPAPTVDSGRRKRWPRTFDTVPADVLGIDKRAYVQRFSLLALGVTHDFVSAPRTPDPSRPRATRWRAGDNVSTTGRGGSPPPPFGRPAPGGAGAGGAPRGPGKRRRGGGGGGGRPRA